MAVDPKKRPVNVPESIWIVKLANGERHFVDRALLGGIEEWAAGQQGITVVQYDFRRVVYHAEPPDEDAKKK